MKILVLADVEKHAFWDYFDKERFEDVDLILSAGDLKASYLEFLVTMTNCPLLYVRGNHDSHYDEKPPLGCIDIDDKIYDFHGLRILGLGGSMRYNNGKDMYTEADMKKRIRKLNAMITIHNGFDILLTHAPAKGYGDMEDIPHQGFECFNELMEKWKPRYMLHGHVHREYGSFQRTHMHTCGTQIINCYEYMELDIHEGDHPPFGQTGSRLYDMYVRLVGNPNSRLEVSADDDDIYN